MMGWGWGAGFHWLGFIWMLLFWGGIIGGAVWVVNGLVQRTRPGTAAREILDERYARGEITREQYAEMKADLTGRTR